MSLHEDQADEGAGAAHGVGDEDVVARDDPARSCTGPDPHLLRPRLKRTAEPLVSSTGDVYFLRTGVDEDLVLEQPDAVALRLLGALDGTRTRDELAREFGADRMVQACAALHAAGLLEDAADDERIPPADRIRYDRQLRYFADLGTGGRPSEHQARLREARIAVLGVGGLGSWASFALACCGVGALVLVDGDRVEESNLNRQILYRESDLGRPKVDAASETLSGFNSACAIEVVDRRLDDVEAVRAVAAGCDLVLSGADWPAHDIERWVNRACFAEAIPFISMSHAPPVVRVGPLYVPGATGCFECQETTYRAEYPEYDALVEQRRGRPSPAAALGPVCAFVGAQVALEAVHHLTGLCRPSTLGSANICDLRTMTVTREPVPRVPGCPVCAGAGT